MTSKWSDPKGPEAEGEVEWSRGCESQQHRNTGFPERGGGVSPGVLGTEYKDQSSW